MKTDTDKTEFFESLISASNCEDEVLMRSMTYDIYIDSLGYSSSFSLSRFAVDLIDYLEEAHPENALMALAVARRIFNQLSK